jgi:hypothetical protein
MKCHFRESVCLAKSLARILQVFVLYEIRTKKHFANWVANLAKWQSTPPTRVLGHRHSLTLPVFGGILLEGLS